ncbi:hypothetical protein DYQ95_06010 [Xanthomonas sp. LMG 9002]|nr:hypothetical protein [Xanthomonas sp. LMG 9002]
MGAVAWLWLWLLLSLLLLTCRVPFRSGGHRGETPEGRRTWMCAVRGRAGLAGKGEALLRPGGRAGAVRRLPRTWLRSSQAPSADPRDGRGPGARQRGGREGRARFLLVTFSLREQRSASQQPQADQSNSPVRAKAFAFA